MTSEGVPDNWVPHGPTLTRNQVYSVQEAFAIWTRVVAKEKGHAPDMTNAANWMKSCLLSRLLIEGKAPLPEPPPLANAAPWYELVEKGEAQFSDEWRQWHEVGSDYWSTDGEERLAICGHVDWTIVDRLDPGYVLTHDTTPGTWRLRPLLADEERWQVGASLKDGPILGTWTLKRDET